MHEADNCLSLRVPLRCMQCHSLKLQEEIFSQVAVISRQWDVARCEMLFSDESGIVGGSAA